MKELEWWCTTPTAGMTFRTESTCGTSIWEREQENTTYLTLFSSLKNAKQHNRVLVTYFKKWTLWISDKVQSARWFCCLHGQECADNHPETLNTVKIHHVSGSRLLPLLFCFTHKHARTHTRTHTAGTYCSAIVSFLLLVKPLLEAR